MSIIRYSSAKKHVEGFSEQFFNCLRRYVGYGGSEVTCRKPDTFLLAATFAAINFAVSLFLLRLLLGV